MKKLFVCVATLLVACSLNATVHKVKASDGAEVLKSTIAEAAAGDTVLVQEGTFTGNFTMKDGVQVIGGWNGLFTSKKDYATILDANADGRVLNQPSDFSTLTIWSNFTIQNGNLKAIDGNKSLGSGVALFKNGRIVKCLVQNNTYSYSGNCLGGGLGNDVGAAGDIMADSCIIRNNKASHGGGVRIRGTIQNSIIEGNLTEANACGGVHLQGGRMYNCIIRNNTGKDTGGARLYGACEIINCLVYGNTGKGSIGGVSWENGGAAKIINNTIVYNNQEGTDNPSRCGFRAAKADANAILANNIIFGNMVAGVLSKEQAQGVDKSIFTGENAITNNAVYNAAIGVNGIKLAEDDVLFTNLEQEDFTLADGCKLIDAGSNAANNHAFDLAGNIRIQGKAIDLGCYEAASKHVFVGQDLQKALDLAAKGDTLLVQAGTFVGNFVMRNGVNVSGGWNEDFTEQTPYGTILDGDAKDRVLTQKEDFDVLTVWDNVTIQNGKFTSSSKPSTKKGAGVYMLWNSQLKNCLIQNNTYEGNECEGGGVAQDKDDYPGDIVLLNCVIKNNTASHGGGVYLRSTAVGCVITENQTTGKHPAGGAHLQWGRLYNCQITKNHSSEDAGGIRAYGNCKIVGCLIADNTCDVKVAGVAIENALSEFVGNTVVNNKQTLSNTDQEYCGVRFDSSSDRGNACCNNIIYGNMAGETVWKQQCSYNIINYKSGINGNNAIAGAPSDYDQAKYINISNVAVDSLFTDYANGDYTLAVTSPMINVGNMDFVQVYDKDLAGNDRVQKEIIDLGCYESPYDTPVHPTAMANTKVAGKAQKVIVNGQLVVVKDNAQYNVLGVKL